MRLSQNAFSRQAGWGVQAPCEGSAPIFFCLDKRKRPRPVKRKPPGRKGGPYGLPFRKREGRADRLGGDRRPRRPCAGPVPRRTAPPHPMVRQKIVGARPDGRISAPARYALLRQSLKGIPQERGLRPTEGGGRIWNPPLHPAGAGTPRRPPRQRAAKRTGRKEEQTKSDRGPVHLPGALCGEQPLHPPGPGTLNGRPGSA